MELSEDTIRSLYYDNLFGTANPRRLRQEIKEKGYKQPTLKFITEFVKKQATAQQFRRINFRPLFVPIVGKEWQYQADLMFFDRRSQKIPILVMIELTSRKAYGRIMTNTKASTTATALESIVAKERTWSSGLNTPTSARRRTKYMSGSSLGTSPTMYWSTPTGSSTGF